jgi:hypothetical protein
VAVTHDQSELAAWLVASIVFALIIYVAATAFK